MTRSPIVRHTLSGTALAVAVLLWLPGLPTARAAAPPAPAVIARVGDRVVDETDIRAAAAALAGDPLRRKNQALWRRKLVDRCIDRELLAMEAERRGYPAKEAVQRRIRDREYELYLGELYRRVLIPGVEPTSAQLDSLQKTRLFRGVDLDYILLPAPRSAQATQIAGRLRQGARFDSTAREWSQHPSRANGGHFGWVLARDLDPRSHTQIVEAKPGDILGPYASPYGIEIYRVRQFQELATDSLTRLIRAERSRGLLQNYQADLLRKYHFSLDTAQVNTVLFLAATEPVERVLNTLGPDGTRPGAPGRRPLGVLARVDGDSITFRDLALADRPVWEEGEKMPFRDQQRLAERCGAVLIPRLVPRDARDRGMDLDPTVARALRLMREEEATRAMAAEGSGGPPDSAAVRAYYKENRARYQRPQAVRARAVCFDADSAAAADAALQSWLVAGVADPTLASHGFRPQAHATATTLWPERYGEIAVLASDSDPVAAAVRGLAPGRLSPAVRSVQGIVVAEALAREAPRPLTFEEAAPQAKIDAAAARAGRWITTVLPRLRSGTRIEVATARLAKVTLALQAPKKGLH
jgi:hypothetical protein